MARISFDTDTLYCDTSDVARFFEQYDDFDPSTNPSNEDVEEHILEEAEKIDRRTGHSWRENQYINEYKDVTGPYYWNAGIPIGLSKRHIRELDSSKGDKLELYESGSYDDWLTDPGRSVGRDEDWWFDYEAGTLHIRDRFFFHRRMRLRITYRYGNPEGPTKLVQKTCAKLVAAELATSDQYSMNIPGTDGGVDTAEMAQRWRDDAEENIQELKEVAYVEPF